MLTVIFYSSGLEEVHPGVHPVQAIRFVGSRPLDLDGLRDQYPVSALHHIDDFAACLATQDWAIDTRGEQPTAIHRKKLEGPA